MEVRKIFFLIQWLICWFVGIWDTLYVDLMNRLIKLLILAPKVEILIF